MKAQNNWKALGALSKAPPDSKSMRIFSFLSGIKQLIHAAYTAFLFTKSNIPTTLIPVTFFAIAAAPINDFSQLPHVIIWIWIHLLQFDVSNQTMDPDEDALNKSDRPLPSKRITLKNAIILRWVLVPFCLAISIAYSVEAFYASATLALLTALYNEFAGHADNFVVRNMFNAGGTMCFEFGATLLAGPDRARINTVAVLAVCISGGIFATTIHAQDFRDVEGDRLIGRQTLPIVFPNIAKYTVIGPLIIWSIALSYIWQLDLAFACIFCYLAFFVGFCFLNAQTVKDKQVAYDWYNVWLSVANVLPGYYYIYRTKA
ncbi:UbiA prenyltransferase family-domain-containing protein [Pholiota molesta]|nr:UbiA prenyltransferase family-domain-containing protein [Pholiota molesta]